MLRNETKSPCCNNLFCKFLNVIWEQGWLNDYSDAHFLIRAMNNDVEGFIRYKQLFSNNAHLFNFYDKIGINFAINLSSKLEYLSFGMKEIRRASELNELIVEYALK